MSILRDYQYDDIPRVIKQWEEAQSTLLVYATGLGKTRVAVELAKWALPGRTLFLAHRGELIWQARRAFMDEGLECEVEKAELYSSESLFESAPVVCAMVQTLNSGKPDKKRMKRFDPNKFKLLIYDESHRSVSKGNKAIVDYFVQGNPRLRVLGLTATPDRLDEVNLGIIFQTIAFERDILFGVDNGWLVEPVPLCATVGSLDYTHVRESRNGDLREDDLCAVLEQEEPVAGMVQPTLETMFRLPQHTLHEHPPDKWGRILEKRGEPMRTIVFTVSVKQSEMLCNCFNRVVPGIAAWVCGKTREEERREIFQSFEAGEIHILCNVDVATEGFDSPKVGLIVLGRPTTSRRWFAQAVGRGTRPLPGITDGLLSKESRLMKIALSSKPHCIVLDFAGNSGKLKLVTVANLMAGNHCEAACEKAMERVRRERTPMKVRELIAEEEKKLIEAAKQFKLIEEAKKAGVVARVKYTTQRMDPFNLLDIEPSPARGWDRVKKLSAKQKSLIQHQGWDPSQMSYSQGTQLIADLFRRWDNHLAVPGQIKVLRRYYPELDYKNLKRERASAILDALAANHWRPVQLDAIQPKETDK